MRVAFRVDASIEIGTGHVMRCLTLADALRARGAECQFICRPHGGNLVAFIRRRRYVVHSLPGSAAADIDLAQGAWPDDDAWTDDAAACAAALADFRPDWLIVDHYGLDARWEQLLSPHYGKLMAIDDLADRPHACALLLDQNFGSTEEAYWARTPADCRILCGARYALLRPEFAALRSYSLQRRARPWIRQLLISLGGVDKDNVTGQVLARLRDGPLPDGCAITVVMGPTAPWHDEVVRQAQTMPVATRVLVDVAHMAQLMADSDLAIGAAGATSWERCCLGLPTIMLVLAENQRAIGKALSDAGAAYLYNDVGSKSQGFLDRALLEPEILSAVTRAAVAITDGLGVSRVADALIGGVSSIDTPTNNGDAGHPLSVP